MSKPWSRKEQEGHSSWSIDDLRAHQKKREMLAIGGTDNASIRALEGRAEPEHVEKEEDEFGGEDIDAAMADVEIDG
jgi:DNA excision repair protein ERCC-2